MLTFIKQNKLLAIIAMVFVFGFVYYAFFMNKGGANELLTTQAANPSPQSQKLLVVLANLRAIQLSESVFKDPVYLSLNDFGVTITPENAGRRNPFEPFSATFMSSTTTTQKVTVPIRQGITRPAN